jgi:hypothetical protein
MFRVLLSHLQEALHKQQLVYCVRVLSVVCCQDWSGTDITHTQYTNRVCAASPEDEQVMLETYRVC